MLDYTVCGCTADYTCTFHTVSHIDFNTDDEPDLVRVPFVTLAPESEDVDW